MYLLYLDDSGSPGNRNEEYFVLGGIAIPEASVRWLSYEIEKVAQKILPNDPRSVEFHAATIFSGKEYPWNTLAKPERIQTIKNVLNVLNNAYPSIATFASAVHKYSYPSQDPVLMAFEDITSRFDYYVQRNSANNDQKGLVIVDESSYEVGLQNLTRQFRNTGNRWGNQLRTICEVPLFVDSKASRIVQLADHIAYSVFRRYNSNDLNYFNCIESKFDQKDNVIHGLSHLHTNIRTCTCPACISRRH